MGFLLIGFICLLLVIAWILKKNPIKFTLSALIILGAIFFVVFGVFVVTLMFHQPKPVLVNQSSSMRKRTGSDPLHLFDSSSSSPITDTTRNPKPIPVLQQPTPGQGVLTNY